MLCQTYESIHNNFIINRHSMSRNVALVHVDEYPKLQSFGIPRTQTHSVNSSICKILNEYFWKFQ